MQKEKKISPKQLRTLFLVGSLAPAVRLIPAAMLSYAGAAVWLAPLAALPLCVAAALLTARLWDSMKTASDAPKWLRDRLGKTGAGIILLLEGVWLSLYAGFVLRSAAERLISTIYNNAQAVFFIGITLAVSLWAALGNLRTVGRASAVVLPVMAALLLLCCVLGVGDIKPKNLLPKKEELAGIPAAALAVANVSALMLYSPLLRGECKPDEHAGKMTLPCVWWLITEAMLMSAAVVGALTAPLAEEVQNPFFLLVRNLSVFGRKERIEAAVIALWLISDLVFLPTLLRAAGWALGGLGKKQNTIPGVWASAMLAVVGTLLWGEMTVNPRWISYRVVPGINLIMTFVFIPGAVLCEKLRRKRKQKPK